MEVNRLHCEQLPGVAILGTGGWGTGMRREHLIHAHQFTGLLKRNMDRRSSSKVFHAFLASDDGKTIRESDGGDLLNAMQNLPPRALKSMMYTYRLKKHGGGFSSVFVTLDGAKEIMNKLPFADETVKNRLKEVFAGYLNPYSTGGLLSFVEATPEQCAQDGLDDDEMTADANHDTTTTPAGGSWVSSGEDNGGRSSTTTTAVIPQYMWRDLYESTATQRVLRARLEAEMEKARAVSSVRTMEVEMAKKELTCFKESAAKDLQIAKLQMQLELAEAKEKLRTEFEQKGRPERDQQRDKVQRRVAGTLRMHARDTVFSRLVSVFWNNNDKNRGETTGVNNFIRLTTSSSNHGGRSQEEEEPMPRLLVNCEKIAGVSENFLHRSFGFCYKGQPMISEETLQRSKQHIKEVYGVEGDDGVQYVCVVLFKCSGMQLSNASTLPYALGLLPTIVLAEKIQGRGYHLAVYKAGIETDDPVLAMLKRPSPDKWFWHSAASVAE